MATAAKCLRAARRYYANPVDYIDPNFVDVTGGGRYVTARLKPLEEVAQTTKLGRGNFAQAFALNDKWVLKVVTLNDPSYEEYAKFCMANKDNPWVPRIRAMFKIKNLVTCYIIERLVECKPGASDKWREFVHDPDKSPCPDFARLVRGFGNSNFTDFYDRNLMVRPSTGQLVVTDPCHYFVGLGRMRRTAAEREAERLAARGGRVELGRMRAFAPVLPEFIVNNRRPPSRVQMTIVHEHPPVQHFNFNVRATEVLRDHQRKLAASAHRHILERANAQRMRQSRKG